MASNYNMLGRPPVLAVNPEGVRTIVRRETLADLLTCDTG
jgi:diaminopimelate decarboxylase